MTAPAPAPELLLIPGLKPVPLADVLYLAGDDNYSRVYYRKPRGYRALASVTLSKAMHPGLLRIHKSYAVNPACVAELVVTGKTAQVRLTSGRLLPVAKRRIKEVRRVLDTIER